MTRSELREFHNCIGRRCRMLPSIGYHYDGGTVRIIDGYEVQMVDGVLRYSYKTHAVGDRAGWVLPIQHVELLNDEVEV